jgi:hypothetical protein
VAKGVRYLKAAAAEGREAGGAAGLRLMDKPALVIEAIKRHGWLPEILDVVQALARAAIEVEYKSSQPARRLALAIRWLLKPPIHGRELTAEQLGTSHAMWKDVVP